MNKEMIDSAVAHSKEHLMKKGELIPMFHAVGSNGDMVIGAPWTDEESKKLILSSIKLIFLAYNVKEYLITSEVWMKRFEKDEEVDLSRRPSTYSDKIEGLMIWYVDYNVNQSYIFEMIRDKDGKLVDLKEVDIPNDAKMSGRMTSLLPERDRVITHEEMNLAIKIKDLMEIKKDDTHTL